MALFHRHVLMLFRWGLCGLVLYFSQSNLENSARSRYIWKIIEKKIIYNHSWNVLRVYIVSKSAKWITIFPRLRVNIIANFPQVIIREVELDFHYRYHKNCFTWRQSGLYSAPHRWRQCSCSSAFTIYFCILNNGKWSFEIPWESISVCLSAFWFYK